MSPSAASQVPVSMVINDDEGASRGRPVPNARMARIARVDMPQRHAMEFRGELP